MVVYDFEELSVRKSVGLQEELMSTMEEEIVFTKNLKEFAFAFADGRIAATSEELYLQLKDEMD